MPRVLVPLLLLAVLCAGEARAQARAYALDPVHTRVMFAVDHAGFSMAIGTVSGSTGTLWFDPEDWTAARLEARVPIAALDVGDAKWNRAVLARNLLDAERHPFAVFVSDRVEPLAADRAAVHGTLTLRGVSKPLTLEVNLNALKRHPMPPFRRTAGFSAVGTLSRSDFGIDAWPSMIGDRVELRIEAEATRTRAVDAHMGAAPDDDDDDEAADLDMPALPSPETEPEQEPTP